MTASWRIAAGRDTDHECTVWNEWNPWTPTRPADGTTADAHAAAPLLNCLLREVAELVEPGAAGAAGVHRLRASGRLLRVRGTRRPTEPELLTNGTWRRLTHTELVKLTAEELRLLTGLPNSELPAEMPGLRT
ncbi:hypothetical protein [Streptomyces tailanensis]|uniref:hypothetical protein n=1 Tax=Streptomyces tailanensis TaxID=2569858 RepID=UPI003CCC5C42